jgi:hypothetical protein
MGFLAFVLAHLPAAPARVLEVGCGEDGGVTPALAERGYDVVGVDPRAPDGPQFRQESIEDFDADGGYDAVVAGRVLHHVEDLGAVLGKLSALAPLIVVDEFAWDRMDEPTRDWYEGQHRLLAAAGHEPSGPSTFEGWQEKHAGLHPSGVVRDALAARYDERAFEWRPYLYHWLGGPVSEALEETLVGAGAIAALGYRYAGERK